MPEKLTLVLISGLILGSYIFRFLRQKRTIRIAFTEYGFSRINRTKIQFRRWLKNILLLFAVILLVKSLYIHVLEDDERDKAKDLKTKSSQHKVLFLLDASLSMITEDVSPSRIEKAKLDILQLVKNSPESQFALIPFAGSAYLQCPFTDDHEIIREYLEVVNRSSISKGGSSLSSALRLALRLFDRSEKKGEKVLKRMIIFSDGADYSGESKNLYEEVKKRGIDVSIVGVGGDELVPIVFMKRNNAPDRVKRDRKNNIVKTKLDEDNLEEIADAMGGVFVTDIEDLKLQKVISSSKKTGSDVEPGEIGKKFTFYVMVPLVILILEILLSTRSRKNIRWAGRFCQ